MFNYDYDNYFVEPSEFEEIVSEAEENIKELFNERVKSVIDDVKEKEKRLKELESQIRQSEVKKARIENDLKETEEQAEKIDCNMPQKYINKFVNKVTKGFAPGDTAWRVSTDYEIKECPFCNGKRRLITNVKGREIEVSCPECQGIGKVRDYFTVVKKVKISRVDLTLCFRKDKVSYWTIECIYVDGDDSRCTVENLFKTEEEAQKEADRRNKENNKSV